MSRRVVGSRFLSLIGDDVPAAGKHSKGSSSPASRRRTALFPPSPSRSAANTPMIRSPSCEHVALRCHLSGPGAAINTAATPLPPPEGRLHLRAPPSQPERPESARGRRSGSAPAERRYTGIDVIGPDPNEKKERPVPEPMILKPFRRGTRHIEEPRHSVARDRYDPTIPFTFGRRRLSPKHFNPKNGGTRQFLSPAPRIRDFVGTPAERLTGIRCHTPPPRAFNILSGVDY